MSGKHAHLNLDDDVTYYSNDLLLRVLLVPQDLATHFFFFLSYLPKEERKRNNWIDRKFYCFYNKMDVIVVYDIFRWITFFQAHATGGFSTKKLIWFDQKLERILNATFGLVFTLKTHEKKRVQVKMMSVFLFFLNG